MSETYGQFLSIAIIGIAFYVLLIRPQQQRQKQLRAMQDALRVGDRIVTIGGVYGTVSSIEESRVGIEVAPGVVMEFDRSAIARKVEA